jgi:hypothetical protein
MKKSFLAAVLACLFSGCLTDYTWTSNVPQKMRTVAVPTFRNQSDVTELGAAASKQLLREFQREGTFSIRRVGDAAIEVQGTIESCDARAESYDRRGGLRSASYRMGAKAVVSVIDKVNGKVLVDNRAYTATVTFAGGANDILSNKRDASRRLADDLARQIVDDVLTLKW